MSDEISRPPEVSGARPGRSGRPVVGMVGGGHLARMTAQAAMGLGIDFRVLAPEADRHGCDIVTVEREQLLPERVAQLTAARAFGMRTDPRVLGRRLVVLVARSPKGQGACYPVMELTREAGEAQAAEVIVPAPGLDGDLAIRAQGFALAAAAELGVTGLLAVELALDGTISELVLGPHEAGLWTIDASRTSQFEQLLRAVLDLPLGTLALTSASAATVTIVGGDDEDMNGRLVHVMAADPGVKVHLYGVPAGPGQRIGHVTAADDDQQQARDRAWRAANYIGPGIDEPA